MRETAEAKLQDGNAELRNLTMTPEEPLRLRGDFNDVISACATCEATGEHVRATDLKLESRRDCRGSSHRQARSEGNWMQV